MHITHVSRGADRCIKRGCVVNSPQALYIHGGLKVTVVKQPITAIEKETSRKRIYTDAMEIYGRRVS